MEQKTLKEKIEFLTSLAIVKAMAGNEEGYNKTMARVEELKKEEL